MSVPHKLSRRLTEVLGDEAADTMVDWMTHSDARLVEVHQELRADMAELRQEMRAGFANIEARFADVDTKFARVDAQFATAEAAAARRHEEFMRWTIGFWVLSLATLVGSVIAIARIIR